MSKGMELHRQLEVFMRKRKGDGIDFSALSDWAYKVRLDGLNLLPEETLDLLEELALCSMGSEFEWSQNDLEQLLRKLQQEANSNKEH